MADSVLTKQTTLSGEEVVTRAIQFFSTENHLTRFTFHNVRGEVVAYAGRWPGIPPNKDTPKYKLPGGFKKSQELFNSP